MREIITLQLGQQSNYLGTHFWNTQESYFTYGEEGESPVDHDVHFRPGIGSDGTETYMPRTVIYDLKGGFGSMRKINALYEAEDGEPTALWNGQTVVQKQQPIELSAYQESLDTGAAAPELTTGSVRYWSDFSRVFYHPRSIVQLNEYELNSSLMPFEKWSMGEELFSSLDKDHDIVDRDLRPFVEEADQMQGVQVMTGIDDAWGGFAAKYLERLRDEYGKTPIWVWGLQEPTNGLPRDKRLLKLVNKARALADMNSQASLVIPLGVPQRLPSSISLDRSSPWHVSALFNAAMESTSLYTRMRMTNQANSTSLGNAADLLNVFGKQVIVNMQLSLIEPPKPAHNGTNGAMQLPTGRGEMYDRLNALEFEEHQSDSGSPSGVTKLEVDLSSLEENITSSAGARGGRKPHLFSQLSTARGEDALKGFDDDEPLENEYRRFERPKTHKFQSQLMYPMLDSYPRVFRDREGDSIRNPVSMRTVLSTDSSVTDKMKGLRTTVLRSIGLEDREDIGNELAEIAEGYKEGWSSGSDDDDDD
ncbi:Protein dml-1 [Pestalotiopsis fici W106-1]|uniref:Protein dml-1 n=1 Tax=Pestalotiopsis fici (strain W106-1 / CGMCC3.15140) TaxID=1229662 RepID=W3XBG1_PESFW|nr:Protein dml-1 [Pestalotiopsis fici W106-1]ETS83380.1 Protein dml-1 [Pestalotiopsis fici W106-1]